MRVYKGKSVCGGIAFGRAKVYKKNQPTVVRKHIDDAKAECRRYEEARDKAKMELEVLYYKATKEIGEAEAQIFSIHQMMLEDADYNQSVLSIIEKQRLNAESAVLTTAESFSKMFSEMDDGYMQVLLEKEKASRDTQVIFQTILQGLRDLEEAYPEYLQLKEY